MTMRPCVYVFSVIMSPFNDASRLSTLGCIQVVDNHNSYTLLVETWVADRQRQPKFRSSNRTHGPHQICSASGLYSIDLSYPNITAALYSVESPGASKSPVAQTCPGAAHAPMVWTWTRPAGAAQAPVVQT
jgi:hypothetical protein